MTPEAFSQESDGVAEEIQQLTETAARGYIAPIITNFGADLNGGLFHKAPSPVVFQLNFEVGATLMGSFIDDRKRTFKTQGDIRFSDAQADLLTASIPDATARNEVKQILLSQEFYVTFLGPTVTGSKKEKLKMVYDQQTFQTSQGPVTIPQTTFELPVTGVLSDYSIVPLATPQLRVGTLIGTMFSFRYIPKIEINPKVGRFQYVGFGIMHNPDIWFGGKLPFDVGIGFFTQTFSLSTDLITATSTSYDFRISKTFGKTGLNMTPYAAFLIEQAEFDIKYPYTVKVNNVKQTQTVSFSLESENTYRLTLGMGFRILAFNFYVDYNIAKINSVTGSFFIGL